MKTVSLIGSTGSIGEQTLDVCRKHSIKVKALAAGSNVKRLAEQAHEFRPDYICIFDKDKYSELKKLTDDIKVEIGCGTEGLCRAAVIEADILVNSVVGMVGLLPTLKAIEAGRDIALANKETLVAGGELVMKSAAEKGVKIYPVDSEHSAIFQCLQGNDRKELRKIILTASGGPFFGKTKEELKNVRPADALKHPNWSMGSKITIDSATLMNKGLEFIEAKWLFGVSPEQIEIVVNRESILHSAVEYEDHSVIAQLGTPDMKIPIQYALLYPHHLDCDVKPLSLTDCGTLTFFKPDFETFDCLSAAIKAIKLGGAYPCIVNSVNEEAVRLFLREKISFLKIGELAMEALEEFPFTNIGSYDDVAAADVAAREFVFRRVQR
ncbi:MAG: 1-deoxy-D-xylulose-5-phosphate reductoisomerase [Oscillospiraceae bacterium]